MVAIEVFMWIFAITAFCAIVTTSIAAVTAMLVEILAEDTRRFKKWLAGFLAERRAPSRRIA